MSFAVAFICTGNICRSPAAERLFRARLRDSADVRVWSAGINGLTGLEMDLPSAVALRELGVDADGHIARRTDVAALMSTDLVLTATTAHRAAILREAPGLMRRAFTLREFGRLAAASPELAQPGSTPDSDALRARVRAIADLRGRVQASDPIEDDIADPYGGDVAVARRCIAEISVAVDNALQALSLSKPA